MGNTLNNMVAEKCSAIFITEDMVAAVIKKIKQRKAGRPSYVIVEMIKAGRKQTVTAITELVSQIIHEEMFQGIGKTPLP